MDHFAGTDPDNNAWWVRRWQWRYSRYWSRLCRAHEAICLLAWEANPPELSEEWEQALEAVAALNSNARIESDWACRDRMETVRKQTYWLKREAIKKATDAGLVFLRMIEWRGKCRTCDGTGEYCPWHWEPGDKAASCRRCSGRGWVALRFIECNVADRFRFHQPYDHTHPFRGDQIDWLQPHPAGTWAPNQPGVKLDAEQASGLLAFLKRRFWIDQPRYVKEIYTYMGVAI